MRKLHGVKTRHWFLEKNQEKQWKIKKANMKIASLEQNKKNYGG